MEVAKGEATEAELDAMIRRRHDKREAEEGHPSEEMWAESVRRHQARRREENRLAWCDYYRHMLTLHRGLADGYDQKLQMLETDTKGAT